VKTAPLKILITSQKGGVGKSTLSANLAAYFCHTRGKKTALIDFDHQATSGKWVKKAYPIGIHCNTADLPNYKGPGIVLLKAKEALRKGVENHQVVVADLTWTDVLSPEFLFEFDLVLVPTSLSIIELDSTLEFINRFSFIFKSRMRKPPKLVLVPSRVDDFETYESIFTRSFNTSFFLAPPVMYSESANNFFGSEFFVLTTNQEVRENFMTFARAIDELGESEMEDRQGPRRSEFNPKLSGTVLDQFRAMRNSEETDTLIEKNPESEAKQGVSKRLMSAIPTFLINKRD
jgi:cellulose biosynthesis protein BcsQ